MKTIPLPFEENIPGQTKIELAIDRTYVHQGFYLAANAEQLLFEFDAFRVQRDHLLRQVEMRGFYLGLALLRVCEEFLYGHIAPRALCETVILPPPVIGDEIRTRK